MSIFCSRGSPPTLSLSPLIHHRGVAPLFCLGSSKPYTLTPQARHQGLGPPLAAAAFPCPQKLRALSLQAGKRPRSHLTRETESTATELECRSAGLGCKGLGGTRMRRALDAVGRGGKAAPAETPTRAAKSSDRMACTRPNHPSQHTAFRGHTAPHPKRRPRIATEQAFIPASHNCDPESRKKRATNRRVGGGSRCVRDEFPRG